MYLTIACVVSAFSGVCIVQDTVLTHFTKRKHLEIFQSIKIIIRNISFISLRKNTALRLVKHDMTYSPLLRSGLILVYWYKDI